MNKSSHNHGLNAARLALVMAGGIASAGAKEVHTELSVTATVRAIANIDLQSTPAALEISASDVRRGYIDVPQPTQLIVRSNSPSGFSLDVLTVAPIFSAMVIQGLDSNTELGADGGSVVQTLAAAASNELVAEVSLRFGAGHRPRALSVAGAHGGSAARVYLAIQ